MIADREAAAILMPPYRYSHEGVSDGLDLIHAVALRELIKHAKQLVKKRHHLHVYARRLARVQGGAEEPVRALRRAWNR